MLLNKIVSFDDSWAIPLFPKLGNQPQTWLGRFSYQQAEGHPGQGSWPKPVSESLSNNQKVLAAFTGRSITP